VWSWLEAAVGMLSLVEKMTATIEMTVNDDNDDDDDGNNNNNNIIIINNNTVASEVTNLRTRRNGDRILVGE
jgi:hypothetical protein